MEEAILPPSLFRLAKSPVQIELKLPNIAYQTLLFISKSSNMNKKVTPVLTETE